MAESPISFTKRSYGGKRKRPCDLCRLRKVFCHIEDGPPCLQCQKSETDCKFIGGSAKRQQIASTVPAGDVSATLRGDITSPRRNDADNEGIEGLGDIPEQLVEQEQEMIMDPGDPDAFYEFNIMEFDSLPYIELDAGPQNSSLEQEFSIPSQNLESFSCHPPPVRQPVSLDSGEKPRINSIDGKDGVHGVYFGLSGETDPYLLRNYNYDENEEFRMFKLVYRQTANDVHSIIPHEVSARLSPESYHSSATTYDSTNYRRSKGVSSNSQLPIQFMMAADELADDAKEDTTVRKDTSPDEARAELDQIVVPEDGSRLIALFLKYVFPAVPITSRSQLGVTSSSPFPTSTSLSKIPTHLLAAMYALALPFYSDDDHLCVSSVYKQPPANQLWRLVFEEIFREIHTPRLSVLQACLLYLQKPRVAAAADTPFRWSFMAFTVGLTTSLGLHLECHDWNIPPWEKRLRKRLWWVVYSEEKWRSLLQGQPTLISRNQWNVSDLSDADFQVDGSTPDEKSSKTMGEPKNGSILDGGLHFRSLASLAQIADDVYQSFYTLRETETLSQDFSLSLSTAHPLRHRLTSWYTSLPTSLSIRRTSLTSHVTNSNASLHLAYLTLEILVYRALLRPLQHSPIFSQSNHANNDSPQPSNTNEPGLHAAASATFVAASHCARLATTFVGDLSARDFAGFWYSWSRIGFATMSNFAMLLIVQAPTGEYAQEAKTIADVWRSTLRAQSKGFEGMKLGLLRLDAIYWRGLERSWRVEDHVKVVL